MKENKFSARPFCLIFVAVFGIFISNTVYAEFIYQECGGIVRGEGEIFSSRTHYINGSSTNGWFIVPDEAVGTTNINARNDSYIQFLPDSGISRAYPQTPEIRYKMNISTPGTYRLYLRREGNGYDSDTAGASDSIFMDIVELKDGTSSAFGTEGNLIADWYEATGDVDGDFSTVPWSSICGVETNTGYAVGYNSEWNITTPGVYTLRFTGREDGAAIDAWVFQLNTLSAPIGNGNLYYERGGIVVGEAEIFSSRTDYISGSSTNSWVVIPDETEGAGIFTNARDNAYIQIFPDDGSGRGPMITPDVKYQMNISTPGTYRLYMRWDGVSTNSGASDSMFVDIVEFKDGTSTPFGTSDNLIADWIEFTGGGTVDGNFATSPWRYISGVETNTGTATGYNSEWSITNAGIYTLRFTEREDGAAVDAWIFQLSSLPAPTGYGLPMSPLEPTSVLIAPAAGDTYLRRADTNEIRGAESLIRIKNHAGSTLDDYDRIGYMRFSLPDLAHLVVTNASLQISLSDVGTNTGDHEIYVAVIAEDASDETFNELTLTRPTSDVWNPDTEVPVDFSKIRGGAAIGSFTINEAAEGTELSFSSPGLLEAIRADTDGVLSVVIYREQDTSIIDEFASKENSYLGPPHLLLDVRPALKNGTMIIVK